MSSALSVLLSFVLSFGPVAQAAQSVAAAAPTPSDGVSDPSILEVLRELAPLSAAADTAAKRRHVFDILIDKDVEPAAAAIKGAYALELNAEQLSPVWTKARALRTQAAAPRPSAFTNEALGRAIRNSNAFLNTEAAVAPGGKVFDGQSVNAASRGPAVPATDAPRRNKFNLSFNDPSQQGRLIGREVRAFTPLVPYFGKNAVRYDRFEWQVYKTKHFDIYYYPAIQDKIAEYAGYAESAYEAVSRETKHDLKSRTPLILYKTHSEFEQNNIGPGMEGILAFAESQRNRVLMPVDWQHDRLYGLIVHELTHIFEYSMLPIHLMRSADQLPLWVPEGFSEYQRGAWDPLDLAMIRDATLNDNIPPLGDTRKMRPEQAGGRLPYNMGHAAFEFIEHKWGKDGVLKFIAALRKGIVSGEEPYKAAFNLDPAQWDKEFAKYMRERFKDHEDRQRAEAYGRELAPQLMETFRYDQVLSAAASPKGDKVAAMTVNYRDQELDIVLIDAKTGKIERNLTPGFTHGKAYDYVSQNSPEVPMLAWTPDGKQVAFLARTGKGRSLMLVNVANGKVAKKISLAGIDEPESPKISPDGKFAVVAGLSKGRTDIFRVELATGKIANLTQDDLEDTTPVVTPDGSSILYASRVNQSHKLFKMDLASKQKTQLTFGAHNDLAPTIAADGKTVYFESTAQAPGTREPAGAPAGDILNVWSLSLENGTLKQLTDARGATLAPMMLQSAEGKSAVGFVTFDGGRWGLSAIDSDTTVRTAQAADYGKAGPNIPFAPALSLAYDPAAQRKKKTFEGFTVARSPITAAVSSGGDFYGGGAIAATDLMGDHHFQFFQASQQTYQTSAFTYLNQARPIQWGVQAFKQANYNYGYNPAAFSGLPVPRDQALMTTNVQGAQAILVKPLDPYRRVEFSAGMVQYSARMADEVMQYFGYQNQANGGPTILTNGVTMLPINAALVSETTVFRPFGPLSGHTYRISGEYAPGIGGAESRRTVEVDARKYMKIGDSGVFAVRGKGLRSWGDVPGYEYFGGNSEMRGYPYLSFAGNKAAFANAELRFPIIQAMLTPIGIMDGIRGTFFFNVGHAGWDGQPTKAYSSKPETFTPIVDVERGPDGWPKVDPASGSYIPVYGQPVHVNGFRLNDARASYGFGIQTNVIGLPMHFDWSYKTLFNKEYEQIVSQRTGEQFRKRQFSFWIGYDF
ncbi:MAG: PD40 domain-containing protein [Elusimicrobia bacterium]|nr:PD40 domain-containing protein [Elusimicrobiota bacterium]